MVNSHGVEIKLMYVLFPLLGVFGILWYVAWVTVIYESPAVHPTISSGEKTLIQATALGLPKVRRVLSLL